MAGGEVDAHLHRATGTNRVETPEQALAHRHAAGHFLEQRRQLLFRAQGRDPLLKGPAIGRTKGQRRIHDQLRDMQRRGTPFNLAPGDSRKSWNGGIDVVGRLLLDDCQHRTQVFAAGLKVLRKERRLDVARPTATIRQGNR